MRDPGIVILDGFMALPLRIGGYKGGTKDQGKRTD
jgi:hypothetical protein